MKTLQRTILGLVFGLSAVMVWAQTPVVSAGVTLSVPAADVLKLVKAGISDDVILGYIQGVKNAFNLNVDEILELRADKVSDTVLAAMLYHDQRPAPVTPPTTKANPDPSALPFTTLLVPAPGVQFTWFPGRWMGEGRWWHWEHERDFWPEDHGWYGR